MSQFAINFANSIRERFYQYEVKDGEVLPVSNDNLDAHSAYLNQLLTYQTLVMQEAKRTGIPYEIIVSNIGRANSVSFDNLYWCDYHQYAEDLRAQLQIKE